MTGIQTAVYTILAGMLVAMFLHDNIPLELILVAMLVAMFLRDDIPLELMPFIEWLRFHRGNHRGQFPFFLTHQHQIKTEHLENLKFIYFCSHFLVTLFLRVPLGQRFTGVAGVAIGDDVRFVPTGSQFPVTLFLRVPFPHREINLEAFCNCSLVSFFLSCSNSFL